MSLQSRMAKGVMWSLLEKGGQQGISFLVFMVIARLVGPTEYGLANICFVFFTIANLLILAVVDGVVSLQIEDDQRLSTLFWTALAVGLGFAAIAILGAQPLAEAMDEPRLRDLILWFSAIPLLLSLASVPTMLVLKELDFRVYALRSIAASLIGGAVGIAGAFQGMGAYALILQQITLFTVSNVVVWLSVRWRPRLRFDRASLAETIRPGIRMAGTMIVTVAEREVPRILIVAFLGPLALGFYSFVARVRYAIQDIFVNPPFSVFYPSLAKLNHDRAAQQQMLGLFVVATGVLIFPTLACAAVAAPLYVTLFFGGKWADVVPLLQVFILCGAVLPLQYVVREMMRTHNRLHRFLRLQVAYVAAVLAASAAALPFGLLAMAAATLAVGVAFLPVYFRALQRWEGVALWGDLAGLWRPLAASGAMAAAIAGYAASPWAAADPWFRLLLALLAGGAAFGLAGALLLRRDVRRLVGFFRRRRVGEA
ncbi:membrane hypothetical protein [uncultured Alphaproteobacteria bacterium]|uniref:Polysaccharide biosynthesis protein n=1 Tax=uncultured Alphaproteobacteria bacterium TaxID=91750 RepID=A0A212JHQ5_9PROT|nr:membrane hypothetical protein [uncultured Alphaproteobacteria bacterium]